MLRHLHIRNLAIIDELSLDFAAGFSVLTGETGAGKSILIDALGLVTGSRAESTLVRGGCDKAEVAAEFSLDDSPAAAAWLAERELADGNLCTIRRVVQAEGRTRAFINGSLVNGADLRILGEALVEVFGQGESQTLLRADTQRVVLDDYGQHGETLAKVAAAAAAVNQLIDRNIDARMARTCGRPLVTGTLSVAESVVFAAAIGSLGFAVLYLWVNPLTAWLTLATLIGYAGVYTLYLKRATPQNIVIGGAAGAFPALIGRSISGDEFSPVNWAIVQQGRSLSAINHARSIAALRLAAMQIAAELMPYDVFLTPTLTQLPRPLGYWSMEAGDLNAYLDRWADAGYMFAFNVSGLPAMSLPMEVTSGNIPIGMQIVGRYGDEATLLGLAQQIENEVQWQKRRPPGF